MESRIEYGVDDSDLILHVRENDESSKDYLYSKYRALIYKEINRVSKKALILGIDFADLSQEAMLAFSHAINSFDENAEVKFMTFATVIIRRKLMNYIMKFETRKNKVMVESVSMDVAVDEDGQNTFVDVVEEPVSSDPLKKIITNESLEEINDIIKTKLSENEKSVLQYDLDGKSVNEIAGLMHMNTKQVYNLIYRARNKLKI